MAVLSGAAEADFLPGQLLRGKRDTSAGEQRYYTSIQNGLRKV